MSYLTGDPREFYIYANRMISNGRFAELQTLLEELSSEEVVHLGTNDIFKLWRMASKGQPKLKSRYQILLSK